MSIESTLQRVSTIDRTLANPAMLLQGAAGGGAVSSAGGVAAPSTTAAPGGAGAASFAAALQLAAGTPSASTGAAGVGAAAMSTGLPPLGAAGAYQAAAPGYPPAPGGAGAQIVAAAESQIGQAEQPPGSNQSPAIAMYRGATAGAIPGAPWCAYFASWAARQAGEPVGAEGQGLGSVAGIWSWAQSVGRAVANGPGVMPQPGDLIVFGDQHVGIVKEVLPDGRIQTIEGNYENKVALNVRTATEATGYVRMS